jgi:hypothetical protein
MQNGHKITFPLGADEAVCPDYAFESLVFMWFLFPNLRSWLCCAFMQPDTVSLEASFSFSSRRMLIRNSNLVNLELAVQNDTP